MKTTEHTATFSELIKGDTPVLVDFYADWCAPCKMMPPILKKLKKMVGDKVTILKVDAEKNPDAAMKYRVRGVPTLILFQNGEIKWQQAGVVQADQLKSIILKHTNNE